MITLPHIDTSTLKTSVQLYDYGKLVFDSGSVNHEGERNSQNKLTKKEIQFIKASHQNSTILGKRFNVSSAHIRNIKRGETWKHL